MIFYVQPVAHILTIAIERNGGFVHCIANDGGDQLLPMLVRAIIVATLSGERGQTIGVIITAYPVVCRWL